MRTCAQLHSRRRIQSIGWKHRLHGTACRVLPPHQVQAAALVGLQTEAASLKLPSPFGFRSSSWVFLLSVFGFRCARWAVDRWLAVNPLDGFSRGKPDALEIRPRDHAEDWKRHEHPIHPRYLRDPSSACMLFQGDELVWAKRGIGEALGMMLDLDEERAARPRLDSAEIPRHLAPCRNAAGALVDAERHLDFFHEAEAAADQITLDQLLRESAVALPLLLLLRALSHR